MESVLPQENVQVTQYQEQNAQTYCDEIVEEAIAANEQMMKLRNKVFDHYNQGPDKSFLKAPIKVYEKALPCVDVELLKKTFAVDIETCKSIGERVNEGRDLVLKNYPKFMAEQ